MLRKKRPHRMIKKQKASNRKAPPKIKPKVKPKVKEKPKEKAKVKEKAKTKRRVKVKGKFNWSAMRRKYFRKNLSDSGEKYTYQMVADELGTTYGTVVNRAFKEKWSKRLEELKINKAERSIEFVLNAGVIDETEIRLRQMNISRAALKVATDKLASIHAEDLTIAQAIDLLKLGLTEERKAVGISDKVEFVGTLQDEADNEPIFTTAMSNRLLGEMLDMIEVDGQHVLKDLNIPEAKNAEQKQLTGKAIKKD